MISQEPVICVGIIDGVDAVEGELQGSFLMDGASITGKFRVKNAGGKLEGEFGGKKMERDLFAVRGGKGSRFLIKNVSIGIRFHWQRMEDQVFEGNLRIVLATRGIVVINEIGLEDYLKSVLSSEMSASSPLEFLKAHAITSRSWLMAMLERSRRAEESHGGARGWQSEKEIVRWYDREDHDIFDVCADDHCQRYQGVTKMHSEAVGEAVGATRGVFLVHDNQICDARFSKACGGRTEVFESAWGESPGPYLASVFDSDGDYPALDTEEKVVEWISKRPAVFCNCTDRDLLSRILPSIDQETKDFFRWSVRYSQEEISDLVSANSGFDFGELVDLVPLQRGPSGRIVRLKIVGSRRTMVVGKELEIRKWLSRSHLYSSAFVARPEGRRGRTPAAWTLRGSGWGHGVGLCQIGAAVMASRGKTTEEILLHYFRGAALRKLY